MTAILDINAKHEVSYCIPISLRDEQIRINSRLVTGRIQHYEGSREEPIAIVGYGPSLATTWKALTDFKTIISCSGAHKFLIEKGIIPTMHCDVDPRIHKIDLLGPAHKDVIYLPASCVHPMYIKHILKSGAEINLWHVFARDGESDQVIPRGEWSLTGGCDVGMRAMTIARFLGHKNLHIFGLDGCEGKTGKHAGKHPNQPKQSSPTVYNGKTYYTTPALLESAKQVFHELDQLPDVVATFYGDGLTQAMAKDYKQKPATAPLLADMKPVLISDEMRKLNQQLHEENPYYGVGGSKYADVVIKIKEEAPQIQSVLDYGCGKGFLQKALPFAIFEYDPAIPGKDEPPRPADLVICTDVLEHIEPDKLKHVLEDLRRVTKDAGFFVIHLGAAKKTYPDGRNAHLIQNPAEWWVAKLKKYFDVNKATQNGMELHVVVGVKTTVDNPPMIIGVKGDDGIKSRFHTPNEKTRWRAETLRKKEPVTIKWVESIPKGAVLYDIGANVGGYAVWAGVRDINVFAFEPEAENYSLLVKNLALNDLRPQAYPIAISDAFRLDTLHMSERGIGGSCHSFAKAVDAFGNHRNGNHPEQGCIGISIDELVEKGLPAPEYIKIDVDGFEPEVIKGAHKSLRKVKGLLIEVNPALPSHLEMVDILTRVFDFTYDINQVNAATRAEGPFKGVAEYVFKKQTATEKHLLKAIEKAELISEPFPHLVINDVLPADEYAELLARLPDDSSYVPIKKARGLRGYPQRFVAAFDRPEWIDTFRSSICRKFGISGNYSDETLLIRDKIGYQIGPHTDHPSRVLSAIFYLATADDHPELGTSIYRPKQKGFSCEGGPHYQFDKFDCVTTIPYQPNSMLVFLKNSVSFHGVEKSEQERNVLLFDLRKACGAP